MTEHPFPPLYDENSRVLILGSFPSVKSREQLFFYGHPQNRFWKVISSVVGGAEPKTIAEKKALLHANKIALWDVIASCEITGSADSSIKNVTANDISEILQTADIQNIYVNGKTAEKYFKKYLESKAHQTAICLPSTSPANAAWSVERLTESWRVLLKDLQLER